MKAIAHSRLVECTWCKGNFDPHAQPWSQLIRLCCRVTAAPLVMQAKGLDPVRPDNERLLWGAEVEYERAPWSYQRNSHVVEHRYYAPPWAASIANATAVSWRSRLRALQLCRRDDEAREHFLGLLRLSASVQLEQGTPDPHFLIKSIGGVLRSAGIPLQLTVDNNATGSLQMRDE